MAETRQPLSFWGTVGANITGGLIVGGASMAVTLIVGAVLVRSTRQEVLEGLRQEGILPPEATEEPGA